MVAMQAAADPARRLKMHIASMVMAVRAAEVVVVALGEEASMDQGFVAAEKMVAMAHARVVREEVGEKD